MAGIKSPDRITPLPFNNGEEYLRLLREAQRESNQSSRVVSLASSRRDTPRDSPKSPPNSPQSELCPDDELRNVYINYWTKVSEIKYKFDFKQNNLTIYLYICSILYAQHRLAINKRSIMGIGCRTGIAASMSSHQSESHNNIDKYRNMIFNVVYSLRREWKFERASDGDEDGEEKKKATGYSIRLKRLGANSLFSREILYSLLVTNVLSLLLGAGFG